MATPSLLFFRLRHRLRPSPSLHSYWLRKVQQATPFSSSPQPLWQPDPVPNLPPVPPPSSEPKAGLSARMSFIFDQIDAIERSRGAKDEALQRIRAWRQSKQLQQQEQPEQGGANVNEPSRGSDLHGVMAAEVDTGTAEAPQVAIREEGGNVFTREVEFVHPWPEWVELMELLVKRNYFDHRRFSEEQVAKGLSIDLSGVAEETGFDFTRDWVTVRTACLNFGRDRFDILRSLSKKDLQILVGNGCPSTDKKVVFSAKLLRKHAHLDEGDVCSACKLRSICSSGYLATKKEDEARTLDVMRVLLTFAFDSINGSVENQTLIKMKSVKIIVRKLLHEVVKLGAVPIDPNLPLPVIKRPPPKVKQPPPPPRKRVGRDDVEMKKGDWLCPKCDFMNFAKNVVCLQCDAKRPKRQLLPGEWECPQCNFLNYRRNMACFHCDQKRPPDEFTDNRMQFKPQGSQIKLDRTERSNVSNAWNFDFDDNESDGADVAAFEFADPPRMNDGSLDGPPRRDVGGGGLENSYSECNYTPRICNGDRRLLNPDEKTLSHVPKMGFDDFDDEDDDVDSYEIDNQTNSRSREVLSKNKYISENDSALDDFDDFESDHKYHGRSHGTSSAWSDDDNQSLGSDSDFSGHPQRKSSKRSSQVLVDNNTNNGMSNDDLELDSDFDGNFDFDLSSKQIRSVEHESHTCGSRRMGKYDSDGDLFGSKSEDYGYRRLDGRNLAPNRGSRNLRNNFREPAHTDSPVPQKFQVNRGRRQRENSFGHTREDGTYGGPTAKIQGARADGYFTRREKSERRGFSDFDRFDRPKNGQFGYEQGGKPDYFDRRQQTNKYRQGKSNQRKNRSGF